MIESIGSIVFVAHKKENSYQSPALDCAIPLNVQNYEFKTYNLNRFLAHFFFLILKLKMITISKLNCKAPHNKLAIPTQKYVCVRKISRNMRQM